MTATNGPAPLRGINWLASYPKSGNTWMRMLLANYFSEQDVPHDINTVGVTNGIASSRGHFDRVLGISSSDLSADEVLPLRPYVYDYLAGQSAAPIWMKVHDAQIPAVADAWLFPATASHAAIYLLRNPLDVAVSLAFHSGKPIAGGVEAVCDPEHTLAKQSNSQLPQRLGCWSRHVASWVDHDPIRTCIVRYEDMLADPARELGRVLAFARPDVSIDPARIALAVEQSRFEALQAAEDATGFREKPEKSARFFRSGRADDWRNHLLPEQVRKICSTHRAMMLRFGYDPDVDPEKGLTS